jgi:hypothetical protein
MERPQRYCTNCGAQVSPGDAFCGSCGTRLSLGPGNAAPTRDSLQAVRERIGSYALPSFSRLPALGHDSLLGALLGHWPWGWAWRLLLLGPIAGLVVGGMVAARGAPQQGR